MREEDKELNCIDCGTRFTFTAGEQKYYEERRFTEPKRCPECRRAKKERKAQETGRR